MKLKDSKEMQLILPEVDFTQEHHAIKKLVKSMENYGVEAPRYLYLTVEKYLLTKDSVKKKGLGIESKYPLAKESERLLRVFNNLKLANVDLEKQEEELFEEIKNQFGDSFINAEVFCPYSKYKIHEVREHYFLTERKRTRKIYDEKGNYIDVFDTVKIGDYREMTDNPFDVLNPYLSTGQWNKLYSSDVLFILKEAHKNQKGLTLKKDITLVEDKFETVTVFYEDTKKTESKKVYLNKKGLRYIKARGKQVTVPTLYVDLKEELFSLRGQGRELYKSTSRPSKHDLMVKDIELILQRDLHNTEKLSDIKKLLEDWY